MRRSILFLMAATVLAAISCTKEVNNQILPEEEYVTMSFNATLGMPTKTELGEANGTGGYKVLWSKDDAIAVLPSVASATTGSTQPVQFNTDIQSSALSATFTGEVTNSASYDAFYAIYPYSAASYWSEKYDNIVVNLPADQTANGIASGIAVASAVDGNLDFEHITGFIKFTIPAEYTDIKEIKFSANNSVALAGQYYIYRDGVTADKFGSSKFTELTLTPSSSEVFAPGTYYFTAFPASLSGFTLTFKDIDNKVATKSTDKSAAIASGHILNLGNIGGLVFESLVPTISDGSYAVLVKSGEDYYYLTNEDTGNSTKRLAAEISGYTELPSSLSKIDPAYVWNFAFNLGEYHMTDNAGLSIAHKSDNSAYVSSSDGVDVEIDENGDGTYSIHYTATDAERYISMSDSKYFVFYKTGVSGATYDLYLVPAVADDDPKITVVNTGDPTGVTATGGVLNGSLDGYNLDGADVTVGFDLNENSYVAVLAGNTFTYSVEGLTTNQTYTYKAWASIDAGLTKVYGEEKTITPEAAVETASVEFVLTGLSSETSLAVTEFADEPITISFAKGSHKTSAPTYYSNGDAVRMYAGNTVTISGAVIRSIEFTASGKTYNKTFNVSNGVCSADANTTCLWEGKSDDGVVLTATAACRWTRIVVTYEK